MVIGYTFLARAYWGGVYNRSTKKLMINHALKEFSETLFHVDSNNTRSLKAMEKIGAVFKESLSKMIELFLKFYVD